LLKKNNNNKEINGSESSNTFPCWKKNNK
jgi:hypothetical protein